MARPKEFISDRNLYYNNREGRRELENITDQTVDSGGNALRIANYAKVGMPIPPEVFEKFGMREPQEDKNASANAENKSGPVSTPESVPSARRRVIGSANAPETQPDEPEADPATCEATTGSGRTCGNVLPCRYPSHAPEVIAE